MFSLNENNKLGLLLMLFSATSYFLGCLFLFNRGFILLSNILFGAGLSLTLTPQGAFKFFMKKENRSAAILLVIGLVIIVKRWTMVGTIVQLAGIFQIVRAFLPWILGWAAALPGIGHVLSELIRVQPAVYSSAARNRRAEEAGHLSLSQSEINGRLRKPDQAR